jgi:hypothetical protein
MEVFSDAELARMPQAVPVTLTKDEVVAVCMQLVRVTAADPKRLDCKSAFTKLIRAAQATA